MIEYNDNGYVVHEKLDRSESLMFSGFLEQEKVRHQADIDKIQSTLDYLRKKFTKHPVEEEGCSGVRCVDCDDARRAIYYCVEKPTKEEDTLSVSQLEKEALETDREEQIDDRPLSDGVPFEYPPKEEEGIFTKKTIKVKLKNASCSKFIQLFEGGDKNTYKEIELECDEMVIDAIGVDEFGTLQATGHLEIGIAEPKEEVEFKVGDYVKIYPHNHFRNYGEIVELRGAWKDVLLVNGHQESILSDIKKITKQEYLVAWRKQLKEGDWVVVWHPPMGSYPEPQWGLYQFLWHNGDGKITVEGNHSKVEKELKELFPLPPDALEQIPKIEEEKGECTCNPRDIRHAFDSGCPKHGVKIRKFGGKEELAEVSDQPIKKSEEEKMEILPKQHCPKCDRMVADHQYNKKSGLCLECYMKKQPKEE